MVLCTPEESGLFLPQRRGNAVIIVSIQLLLVITGLIIIVI